MMRWLDKQVPLPFGAIDNRRSLVALDNLVDLIIRCCSHPGAANQTFLVSDGRDVSTTELLRQMASALGKPSRLIPVPSSLLVLGANLLGRRALSQRLCGSLQVDISQTCQRLEWVPPVTLENALRRTAEYYLENKQK
jgi:nucleoside-diphosphate-sugar epimerase